MTAAAGGRCRRVLMVAHGFPPTVGGVETHVADLARAMARRGHVVACLVGGDVVADEEDRGSTFTVHRRPALAPAALLRMDDGGVRRLADLLQRSLDDHLPDVVHVHNAHHFSDGLAAAVFEATGRFGSEGRPLLVNGVHDHVGNAVCPELLDRFAWDLVLYVSACTQRALPTRRPWRVEHLGIDLERFRGEGVPHHAMAGLERPVIFHPARLLPWKGPDVGLEAFVRVRRHLGRGTLVLSATEEVLDVESDVAALRAQLEGRARRAAVDAHVRFLHFPLGEMPSAYRGADLVWYPTIADEPFGLAPLEALACGVPVVVTASGGMVETLVHGETALVVAKGDSDALAQAALRVLTDGDLRHHLTAQAARHLERYTIDRYAESVAARYEEAACRRGCHGGRTA